MIHFCGNDSFILIQEPAEELSFDDSSIYWEDLGGNTFLDMCDNNNDLSWSCLDDSFDQEIIENSSNTLEFIDCASCTNYQSNINYEWSSGWFLLSGIDLTDYTPSTFNIDLF